MSAQRIPWQEKLQEQCRALQAPPPIYKEYSDRRGGRTAWTVHVHIGPVLFAKATYWYDGKCAEKAKDDAAENMLKRLNGAPTMQAIVKQEQEMLMQQQQQQQQHQHQAIKMEQVRSAW
ncbi:hypothetical protein IWZ01DRAFT_484814 [Phyllosticta capitalensis]